jgi:hypothetical protein
MRTLFIYTIVLIFFFSMEAVHTVLHDGYIAGFTLYADELLEAEVAEDTSDEDIFDEDDIFDSDTFDRAVEESVSEEKKTGLEKQFGGDIFFSSDMSIPYVINTYGITSWTNGKVFAKLYYPDIAAFYVGYNFQHDFLRFSGSSGKQLSGDSLFKINGELAELFLDFDIKNIVFFRMGNQLISWGPSFFWTPVDFVNITRIDPLSTLDLRVGKPGFRIHVPADKSNFFTFFDFSKSVDRKGNAGDIYETLRIGMRYDRVISGYEVGLSTYFGSGLSTQLGIDFSGILLRSDFYGEAALSQGSNIPKAVSSGAPGKYEFSNTDDIVYAFSIGIQKSFGEFKYWQVSAETFYNSNGYGKDPPIYFLIQENRFSPLYTGKVYGYLSLQKSKLFHNADITGSLSYLSNFSDLSFNAYGTLDFRLPKIIPFGIKIGCTGGKKQRTFTPYGRGDIYSSLYTQISF